MDILKRDRRSKLNRLKMKHIFALKIIAVNKLVFTFFGSNLH